MDIPWKKKKKERTFAPQGFNPRFNASARRDLSPRITPDIPRGCFRFRFEQRNSRAREAKIRNTTTSISTNPLIYGSRATSRIGLGEGGKWRRAARKGSSYLRKQEEEGSVGIFLPFLRFSAGSRGQRDLQTRPESLGRQRKFKVRPSRWPGRSDDLFGKKWKKRENRFGFSTSIAANFRRSPLVASPPEGFTDHFFPGGRIFLSSLWKDFLFFFLSWFRQPEK